MPAIKELRQLYAAMSGLKWVASGAGAGEVNDWGNSSMPNFGNYSAARTAFNTRFTTAGGKLMELDSNYWSSTQDMSDVFYFKFYNSNSLQDMQNFPYYIRAISVF